MILWFLLVMQPFTDREWEFMHEYVDHKSSKKASHTHYRALGPELISMYRQSARSGL